MSFNINEFTSKLTQYGGVQRSNKFKVFITPPNGLNSEAANIFYDIPFFAEQTTLPGVNLSNHDVRRYGYGPIEKRPIGHTFTDLSITFIADGMGKMHFAFKEWISLISPFDTKDGLGRNYLFQYKDSYKTDFQVLTYVEKEQTDPTIELTLMQAFPLSLSDSQLAWSDSNNYSRFTVQFAYVDWNVKYNDPT